MHQPGPNDDRPSRVPGRTTPTWEMELLLSGATVFALWQIAGAMAPFAAYLLPRLAPQFASIGGVIYIYLASGVIMIGLAFVIHLILRAYWVAMVGMHSVFPEGLRLDRLRGGPLMRETLLARWQDMDAAIERADNRATVVFGLGIGVASVLIPITLAVLAVYLLVAGVCSALGDVDSASWAFPIVTLALMLPYFVVVFIDRRFGERLDPKGWSYRACLKVFAFFSYLGMGREANPLVTLYSSNVGERRGTVVVMAVMLSTLLIATVTLMGERQQLGIGSYAAFPEPYRGMPGTVDGRHYASMQERDSDPLLPYLPDPVVGGDYLRLVVPYVPRLHARDLERCGGRGGDLDDRQAEAQRRSSLLDCFGKRFTVTMDGQTVPVGPDWYTDPRRNVRGLLFMVPAKELAPGRHELVVTAKDPDPADGSEDDETRPLPDVLPFWR